MTKNMLFDPPSHVSDEFRLVAACSWLPASKHSIGQKQIVDALSVTPLNWSEVASLVLRHDVVGQFCSVMGKRDWKHVPPEVKERLKRVRGQQTIRALSQTAELARVAGLFSENGIPLISLKGVALSRDLYGDPCLRSSVDLDILVRPEDIERSEELLTRAGYCHSLGFHGMGPRQKRHIVKTLHHHEYFHEERRVHLELHWRSYLWTEEQVTSLWQDVRPITWHEADLNLLSSESNILFLADHGARHGWPCLKWLSDLAMLMQELKEEEWLSLYEKAAYYDLQRVICQTAVLLEFFYGINPPESFRKLYLSDPAVQKLSGWAVSQLLASSEEMARRMKRFYGARLALLLKQLKPGTPFFSRIRGVLITHEDFVDFPLPDPLFWLYIPLRPFLWFRRHYLKTGQR